MVASGLLDRDARVIDVALRYGYDSPTAFARAFKRVHGISPSEAKNGGVKLASYNLSVNTIGDLYSIQGGAPRFAMPQLSLDLLRQQLPNGFTIAGMVHAVVLLAVLVLLMPYATLIPMPCIPTTSPCAPWSAPALLTRLAARTSCPTSTPPSPAPPFWWTRSSEDGAARVCRYNGKVEPLRKRTGIKPHGISC